MSVILLAIFVSIFHLFAPVLVNGSVVDTQFIYSLFKGFGKCSNGLFLFT